MLLKHVIGTVFGIQTMRAGSLIIRSIGMARAKIVSKQKCQCVSYYLKTYTLAMLNNIAM